jgi:hypothetical protein
MLNTPNFRFFSLVGLLTAGLLFTQCAKEDDEMPAGQGTLRFEITDAPIDDAGIQGAFVTVTDIKVDGQSFAGFQGKQTIDLMAYQNGAVKALGDGSLDAGAYNNITLVIDRQQDADGNQPGCYVLTADNKKHALSLSGNTGNEITFGSGNLTVEENQTSEVLIDFNLRKAITRDDQNAETDYSFVTQAELNAALRAVNKAEAGRVEGKVNSAFQYADKVVVYAYEEGTFDDKTETSGQGASQIRFKNAVTSATVAANGDYELHFLEAGDYELYFAAYEDTDQDGAFEFQGSLQFDLAGSLMLQPVSITSQAAVTLDVDVLGLLPF